MIQRLASQCWLAMACFLRHRAKTNYCNQFTFIEELNMFLHVFPFTKSCKNLFSSSY